LAAKTRHLVGTDKGTEPAVRQQRHAGERICRLLLDPATDALFAVDLAYARDGWLDACVGQANAARLRPFGILVRWLLAPSGNT
jgi:hypothetical protein